MSSIKNKITTLENHIAPKDDFAKRLIEDLLAARERVIEGELTERLRHLEGILKDRPDISPEDTAEIAKVRGQHMRERLRNKDGEA